MVFDNQWFHNHQKGLLFLCNNFILKYWFRWILRINKDLKWSEKIIALEPNNYKVVISKDDKEVKVRVDFRTHEKFGKRLYYAFKPFWYLIHGWDWMTWEKPEWNLGFDTLTSYPQAGGGGGNTTCDGTISRFGVNESFASISTSAGNGADAIGYVDQARLVASSTSNQFTGLSRGGLTFDTSSITAVATISAATFSIRGDEKANGLGAPALHLAGFTPANNNNLVTGDYLQTKTTSFGNIAYASYVTTSTKNDISLNTDGIANISKTGISRFSLVLSWDIIGSFSGSWSSGAQSKFYYYSADNSGTTDDPVLVVTYTIPATSNFFLLF